MDAVCFCGSRRSSMKISAGVRKQARQVRTAVGMHVVLEITGGPATGQRGSVVPGGTLRVGRHGDNDIVVTDDPTMSRWHFELHHDGATCRVRDVNSRSGTFLNGQKLAPSEVVRDLDDLKAGLSRFRVLVTAKTDDVPAALPFSAGSDGVLPAGDRAAVPVSIGVSTAFPVREEPIEATLSRARLEPDLRRTIAGLTDPREIVTVLASRGEVSAAVRLVAAAMPPHNAVGWACRCIRSQCVLSELDEQALAAADRWAVDPTETHRRETQAIAERLDYGTAAAWAAMAAFWSGGSLTPAEAPPVPPPDDLLPQAIVAALSLAFQPTAAERCPERLAGCLAADLLADATIPPQ